MVILYIGKERCELPYFMYRMARIMNRNVLVVDNSVRGDLYRSIANAESDYTDMGSSVFVRNCYIKAAEAEKFDVTLIYNGINVVPHPYEISPDYTYVETTMERVDVEDVKKAYEATGIKNPATLVVTDVTAKKYSVGTLVKNLGLNAESCYMIPFDIKFQNKYLMLTHNGSVPIKGSSEDVMEFLEETARRQYACDKRKFKKIARM